MLISGHARSHDLLARLARELTDRIPVKRVNYVSRDRPRRGPSSDSDVVLAVDNDRRCNRERPDAARDRSAGV